MAINPLYIFLAIVKRIRMGDTALGEKSFEEWVIDAFEAFRTPSSAGYVLKQNKREKKGEPKSDAVSAGLGGQFPDLLLTKAGENTVFIECKGEEGLQDLQFNSTPPCGVNTKKDDHFRTFYIIGLRQSRKIERIALVDGYYFNSDVDLIDKVWEFVADSLERNLPNVHPSWRLARKGKGGRDIEPYITHIGSYSEDPGIRARIRRMYHVINPLKTFPKYKMFAILPMEYLPSVRSRKPSTSYTSDGVELAIGSESPINRHEIIGERRVFDLLLLYAYPMS